LWFFPNFLCAIAALEPQAIAPFSFYLIVGWVERKNLTPHLELPIDIGLFAGNPWGSIRVWQIPLVRAKHSDYKLSVLINRFFARMLWVAGSAKAPSRDTAVPFPYYFLLGFAQA